MQYYSDLNKNRNLPLILLAVSAVAYVLLFEFILPVNSILPRPYILIESFASLRRDYGLWLHFFYSASGVYFSLIAGYLLFSLSSGLWISLGLRYHTFLSAVMPLRYVPFLSYIAIFLYWFPERNITEYVFSILLAFLFLLIRLLQLLPSLNRPFIESALSLGADRFRINREIVWKDLQPGVFGSLKTLHYLLWSVMLVFEFVKNDLGLGSIYRTAHEYRDVSALLVLTILVSTTVFIAHKVIGFVDKRIIFWK